MERKIKRYGWCPDLPDHRDQFVVTALSEEPLPAHVDLRESFPAPYDQGELGSCTANAIAAAIEFDQKKEKIIEFTPSRLFIYYMERNIENAVSQDSGAQIRDGIKACAVIGACPETRWPYDISKFTIRPTPECYISAREHKIQKYARVTQDLDQMRAVLAGGSPIVFGFTVYDSFEGEDIETSGVLNMPAASEKSVGGHAVIIVGYDDASKRFIVRNSWGEDWGDKGYFTMPYEYVLDPNLADDFWTIYTTK